MSRPGRVAGLAALLCAAAAGAQDRPDENAMFGATEDAGTPPAPPAADAPRPSEDHLFGPPSFASGGSADAGRDARELSGANVERNAFASGETVANPLSIGGLFYQRGYASVTDNAQFKNVTYSLPLQVNGFMDARPNDRIRGFVLARLQYDPTLDGCSAPTTSPVVDSSQPCPRYAGSTTSTSGGAGQTSSTSTAATSFGGGTALPSNPAVLLDQAWLKFDIERAVFVTVGKQHVKWGASRFWNPTDFLHTQRRDPLLPYDLRLGNNMVKFEVPLESAQTNVYAVALFDNPQAASTLGQLGGAFRVEKVFGTAEAGIEAVVRNGLHPVLGGDISMPLGPFDAYAEASYREHADLPPLVFPTQLQPVGTLIEQNPAWQQTPYVQDTGQFVQVSGGLTYSFGYMDNRLATVGLEYFYNSLGLPSSVFYPLVIFGGAFQPFYTGQHYGALYATFEGPDQFKHTNFTVSNLGNLSDRSFISRVDFSWRVLTYLTFEAYADVHYGHSGGEFRFSIDGAQLAQEYGFPPVAAQFLTPIYVPPAVFDCGFGLRVSI